MVGRLTDSSRAAGVSPLVYVSRVVSGEMTILLELEVGRGAAKGKCTASREEASWHTSLPLATCKGRCVKWDGRQEEQPGSCRQVSISTTNCSTACAGLPPWCILLATHLLAVLIGGVDVQHAETAGCGACSERKLPGGDGGAGLAGALDAVAIGVGPHGAAGQVAWGEVGREGGHSCWDRHALQAEECSRHTAAHYSCIFHAVDSAPPLPLPAPSYATPCHTSEEGGGEGDASGDGLGEGEGDASGDGLGDGEGEGPGLGLGLGPAWEVGRCVGSAQLMGRRSTHVDG